MDSEIRVLQHYRELALANGVGHLPWLTAEEVREMEPAVTCVQAIHSPTTGIVDSHQLMLAFLADLEAANGQLALRAPLLSAAVRSTGFELHVGGDTDSTLRCRELVNCAGLAAPDVARSILGLPSDHLPVARYAKGHYFSLSGKSPFHRLVYPVAESAGLGIHVTLDLAGRAKFGPDVEWVDSIDYGFDESRRGSFEAAIRRYFPTLDPNRLQAAYTGIRPKIVGPGEPAADFRIDGPDEHGVAGFVNLMGIESPGLTAALAIGCLVRTEAQ